MSVVSEVRSGTIVIAAMIKKSTTGASNQPSGSLSMITANIVKAIAMPNATRPPPLSFEAAIWIFAALCAVRAGFAAACGG
jgi:hypothetical protein